MMPEGASRRSEQMALMSVMSHHMVTDPELSDLLDQAEASDYSQLGGMGSSEFKRNAAAMGPCQCGSQ